MRTRLLKLWRDDSGCVPATEWMLVATILTLGLLAATLALHHADELANDEPPALVR